MNFRKIAFGATILCFVSLLIAAPAGSAVSSARRGSLTISVFGRHGQSLHTQAHVVRLRNNVTYHVRAGRTRSLPAATYVVFVDIRDSQDHTSTLGAKRVTVDGAEHVPSGPGSARGCASGFSRPHRRVTRRTSPSPCAHPGTAR